MVIEGNEILVYWVLPSLVVCLTMFGWMRFCGNSPQMLDATEFMGMVCLAILWPLAIFTALVFMAEPFIEWLLKEREWPELPGND